MVNNEEIEDALDGYYAAKSLLKRNRDNLVRLCVECGIDQGLAVNADVALFLGGYLAGRGGSLFLGKPTGVSKI